MNTLEFRLISSYNKVFPDDAVTAFGELTEACALRNDLFAFEAALRSESDCRVRLRVETALAAYLSVYRVGCVPVAMPAYAVTQDENYLRGKQPGDYPDRLIPFDAAAEALPLSAGKVCSLWFELNLPADAPTGVYPIKVTLTDANGAAIYASRVLTLEVLPVTLPEQKLMYTQWFHADCLATYYGVEVFSEEHWRIIENFARTAVKNGVNMLLMPVFTPPLDTAVGGERPTVQLVGITKDGDRYSFDFTGVDRWLAMCERVGVKYHEIVHLFTQWGAEHAPKIMATDARDGSYRRLFGWETDSLSEEYLGFLRQFLAALKGYLAKKGLLDKTMFHLSDEPGGAHLERYRKLREALAESLDGLLCGDALSGYDFYKAGAVKYPIVATNHIEPFLQNNVPDLWCYYCCSQHEKVSNRFIAMSMNRTRVIGTQLFKFHLRGFLQWGYNFYYSQYSTREIDPFTCNDGCGWVPAGDAFSVYPAADGTAEPSLHMLGFTQALYDLRAFELLAARTSHEKAVALIEKEAGMAIRFDEYPLRDDFCEKLRFAVNRTLAQNG